MSSDPQSVIISGIGSYLPKKVVTNDDLALKMETSDEWIRTRTGIRQRRIADDSETPSFMGAEAAKKAIQNAGLEPKDIDVIITGTMSPDLPVPSTSCIIQDKLGLRRIPSFDVGAACSGFLYSLETGAALVQSGRYKNALVIGTEKMSGIVNWDDRRTCILFGDAGGACILTPYEKPGYGIIDTILCADGCHRDLLYMPAGGSAKPATPETIQGGLHYLQMNGKEVFKLAVNDMGATVLELIQRNGLKAEDIASFVPHQANIRIIEALANKLKLPIESFYININKYGNTSAASIPLALHEAQQEGYFKSGDYIVLSAFGAGLTWGATLIKWL